MCPIRDQTICQNRTVEIESSSANRSKTESLHDGQFPPGRFVRSHHRERPVNFCREHLGKPTCQPKIIVKPIADTFTEKTPQIQAEIVNPTYNDGQQSFDCPAETSRLLILTRPVNLSVLIAVERVNERRFGH